ncbi:hypothetical protein FCM35_KLT00526 [Carex littledalei]|uniref:Uncharacterized protein n=1 Tax=Carex littledalei TaxID=544730 RepID=A0A833RWK4_9POAL|nr:hypothetical protein FCM35_KLT00526 [Carex littledalei]
MSTTKALPVLCILFLFFTSSLVLHCTEAVRTLVESKADAIDQLTIGYPPAPSSNINRHTNTAIHQAALTPDLLATLTPETRPCNHYRYIIDVQLQQK